MEKNDTVESVLIGLRIYYVFALLLYICFSCVALFAMVVNFIPDTTGAYTISANGTEQPLVAPYTYGMMNLHTRTLATSPVASAIVIAFFMGLILVMLVLFAVGLYSVGVKKKWAWTYNVVVMILMIPLGGFIGSLIAALILIGLFNTHVKKHFNA